MTLHDSKASVHDATLGDMPGEQPIALARIPRGIPAAENDQVLMERIAGKDQKAFRVFACRHVPKCLAVSQRLIGNASDAEEIVQDAMMRVWRHAPSWRRTGTHVTTWLYRIVVNLSIDCARKRRQRFVPLDDTENRPTAAPGPQAAAEGRQLEAFLLQAIAALPPRQRMALTLCCFEAMDCAQAARVMEISVSAIESLLVRARRTLHAQLRDRGFIEAYRPKPRAGDQPLLLPLPKAAPAGR